MVIYVYGQRIVIPYYLFIIPIFIYTCILVGEGSYRGGSISHWPWRGSVTLQVCLSVIVTTPLPTFSKKNFFFLWGGVSLYQVYFLFTVETKINKDLRFHSFVILMKWLYRDLILQNVFQHNLYFHTQVLGCYQIHSLDMQLLNFYPLWPCSKSGVTDYFAQDDIHALHLARRCIKNINYSKDPKVL